MQGILNRRCVYSNLLASALLVSTCIPYEELFEHVLNGEHLELCNGSFASVCM
jgi:hypothetical protein